MAYNVSMLVLQEATEWSEPGTPNHIYITDNGKTHIYAYIIEGTEESKIFSTPIPFSTKGRKFEVLQEFEIEQPGIPVQGSKGDMYYVTKDSGTYFCTCSGFRFRGSCRHIEKVAND